MTSFPRKTFEEIKKKHDNIWQYFVHPNFCKPGPNDFKISETLFLYEDSDFYK